MSELIPAILPKDFAELEDKMCLVAGRVPLVHIDVTDGTLTRGITWPKAGDRGEWQNILNEEEGLPCWEELNFEVHLMIKDPLAIVDDWTRAGAERLTVHLEAFESDEELSLALNDLRNRFSMTSFVNTEVGLAVNFDTPIESVLPHVEEADFVHLMSIAEIGAQGHGFEEGIFERIAAIRDEYPDTIISVDGGVGPVNVERLIDAGVNRLIVGSAIYAAPEPLDALDELLEIVQGHELFN